MKVFGIIPANYNNYHKIPIKTSDMNFKAKGVYPGSFDPITNGHLDIIDRARKFLDTLVVAIGINPEKVPLFTPQQRVNLIKKTVKLMENVKVEVYEGMTVNFAEKKNAELMIRGVRNPSDYEFEQKIVAFNKSLNPKIDTIILPTNPSLETISSSLVKKKFADGEDISSLVPTPVYQALFLKKNLDNTLKNIGLNENESKIIFNNFLNAYDNSSRMYHGLSHIENMLIDFDKIQKSGIEQQIKNPEIFKYAIFMHDYINATPTDVSESAEYALNSVNKAIPNDTDYLKKLIMATDYKNHPEITTFDEALMQDLDIAVLGSNHEKYKQYSQEIREEYKRFENSVYNPNRIKVLQNFLSKEHIFNTQYFRNIFEQKARENIQAEINSLI